MEAIFYVPTNFTTAASGHCDKKPKETTLKQELQSLELMNAGFAWFGPKMMELRHAVNQSESLSRLSLMLAVQAYTVVIVPEILKPAKWKKVDGEWLETEEMAEFKSLRATMRDGIAWRLIGFMLGIDSREAAESILKDLLCDIVSENPEEASPFAAVLHAYLMITRDVMRTVLLVECRQEKICRAAGIQHTDQTMSVPADGMGQEFLGLKALMIEIQQQTANLRTEVDRMKISRTATAEESQ